MASKSDLLEAQNFSRRRLLTAFVSGAPGGKELEPAKPLRAVFIGVGLSIAVLLVGLFMGLFKHGLTQGWENGKLIIDSTTGSRYVSSDGTLHPVLNIASARLLLDAAATAKPIKVDSSELAGKRIGSTLGIPGAPDTLPAPSALVNSGWTACVAPDGGIDTRIRANPIARAVEDPTAATVVTSEGKTWILSGDRRYEVSGEGTDGILRDLGLGTVRPVAVPVAWLNLFMAGTPVTPISVDDAGKPVAGTDLRVGDVVHTIGTADDLRSVVMPDGTLAAVDPFTLALYQHGRSYSVDRVLDVPSNAVSGLATSTAKLQAEDWPTTAFTALRSDGALCALSGKDDAGVTTMLATTRPSQKLKSGTVVDPSAGALVHVAGRGEGAATLLVLIDATATTFAIPDASAETVKKLGYDKTDEGNVDVNWVSLFRGGPDLSPDAAGSSGGS